MEVKTQIIHDLHCGACGQTFQGGNDLSSHLDQCVVAKVLLPMTNVVMWGGDRGGHPIAALIVAIRESVPLIRKYAMAVATDVDTFYRAQIHRDLCRSLGVSREKFKPFENQDIKNEPSPEEAEKILWQAIGALRYVY